MSDSSAMSIFKYLSKEEYALDLIEKGHVRFCSLAYFRAYEDAEVRGDPHDGKLLYKPAGGLTITKTATGETFQLDRGFRAAAKAEEIFVYCMSNHQTAELAEKFGPFCVEIKAPLNFLARIRCHVRLRTKLDRAGIYANPVDYRDVEKEPGADWALPEKLAFIKPPSFAWQDEYRIVVGNRGAFAPENVQLFLEANGAVDAGQPVELDPLVLKLGNISKIAALHRI